MWTHVFVAIVWFVAPLIVVPWFVLAAIPILAVPVCLFGLVAAAPVFLLGSLSEGVRRRTRPRARPLARERALAPAFKILVPGFPTWTRDAVEALLAGYARRSGNSVRACSCMVQKHNGIYLTVQLRRGKGCLCHQVKAASPEEALRRMRWKLVRSAQRHPSGTRVWASSHRPKRAWCLAAAVCPEKAPVPIR